jgi:hypothetical protein
VNRDYFEALHIEMHVRTSNLNIGRDPSVPNPTGHMFTSITLFRSIRCVLWNIVSPQNTLIDMNNVMSSDFFLC